MRKALGSAVGVFVLLVQGTLHADTPIPDPGHTARLAYEPSPDITPCPNEDALKQAVIGRLGYDPFRAEAPRLVSVGIKRSGRTLVGDVTLRSPDGVVLGSRQLSSHEGDCSELVASISLAISIAIDPEHQLLPPPVAAPSPPAPPPHQHLSPPVVAASPPAPPPTPTTASPACTSVPPTPRPAPPPVSDHRPRVSLGAGGIALAGVTPAPALGVTFQTGLRWRRFSIDIGGEATSVTSMSGPLGGSVNASLLAGTVAPCVHLGPAMACGLAAAGSLRGFGSGLDGVSEKPVPWAGLGFRAGGEVPLTRVFAFQLFADATATLVYSTFRFTGQDVWKTPPIAGALGAALIANLP